MENNNNAIIKRVNALTGLCLISTFTQNLMYKQGDMSVNALTGLCLISTTMLDCIMSNTDIVSMPSRAYASFLHIDAFWSSYDNSKECQCPHGLMPHFYQTHGKHLLHVSCYVSMPSRAYASFLLRMRTYGIREQEHTVSMPSRAYASFLRTNPRLLGLFAVYCVNALTGLCLISTCTIDTYSQFLLGVNALTGLCLISTVSTWVDAKRRSLWCQCPHGLMPHFYSKKVKESFIYGHCVNALSG